MKLGAEPKKLVILGVLVLLAGYLIVTGAFSSRPGRPPSSPSPTGAPSAAAPAPAVEPAGPVPRSEPRVSSQGSLQDFRPSLKSRRGGEQRDFSSIDPTLRLDLLAKLEEVQLRSAGRSLFEFSAAPLPKTPEEKVIPRAKIQTVPLPPPPPPPPEAERKPPPPPIPLKFFGYSTAFRQGNRRAFFMDGDQILVASEGEVLKKRYRIVRIGVNSVVMEDLEFKAEQTLPLEPQAG
ncbi:MAG TPA: hypothetical protein VLH09_11705 [Bryobacteraceae bacterium]|nr:hypothetical protein [Bryobacteraceae bacterium]